MGEGHLRRTGLPLRFRPLPLAADLGLVGTLVLCASGEQLHGLGGLRVQGREKELQRI